MKPERYLLDMDPAASRGLTHGEAMTVTCKYCNGAIEIKPDTFLVVPVCDLCQVGLDKSLEQEMMAHGHDGGWPLYWTGRGHSHARGTVETRGCVSTFYGRIEWPVFYVAVGFHNIARRQYRLNWRMPDGMVWCGTVYGDNTQLVRSAKQMKQQP